MNDSASQTSSVTALAIGAIGVVFGDIGTSPLYATEGRLQRPRTAPRSTTATSSACCRLIFWALILVVSLKYVAFIMRADNKGEGGIMALMALAQRVFHAESRRKWLLLIAGLVRRRAVLWRRHDHARHLGALRRGRPGSRGAGACSPVSSRSHCPCWSGCSCSRGTAPAAVGKLFGPIMMRLVRHPGGLGVISIVADARRC